ncbi:MAG TPA: hypothetical protein VM345_06390 [Acidimicrobiales bacterium]|nr:hypothetical protein [Acidimicrobiales bacterium]
MAPTDPAATPRGRGRPRMWATEAERARAYRERKAEEHASVDELRVERRMLQRKLSDALRGRERAEKALEAASAQADRLAAEVERVREQLRDAQAQVSSLRRKNEELLATPAPQPLEAMPGVSRQQRRALERTKRKRGR